MRKSILTALTLLCIFSLSFSCSDDDTGSQTDGGVTDGTGSQTDGVATGDLGACTPKTPVAPVKDFFKDISESSGIRVDNYVKNPPSTIPINDHSRLAFADLNGDGYEDIVAHSLYPNPKAGIPFEHLIYMNKKDGTFSHASDASGLRKVQAGFFAFGDVDNDGDLDCFAGLDIPLTGYNSQMLLNDGKGVFTAVADAGFGQLPAAANAVFGDFNSDGKLDLFVGRGHTAYAAPDMLYIGKGDGTFTNTSTALTGNVSRPSNGSVGCDYDNDGDLDIFISTYGVSSMNGHNVLFENDGKGNFKDVAVERGFAALATGNYWLSSTGNGTTAEPGKTASNYMGSNGFGLECIDINNDGNLDIWITTISHPSDSTYSRKWSDPSQVLINQGAAGKYAFVNEYLKRKIPFNEGDVDGGAVDFDNDGRVDLSASRERKYEGSYTTDEQKGWFGLHHQQSDGTFKSVGLVSGINDMTGTESFLRMKGAQNHAWADIDGDGDLDLLVGGRGTSTGRPNFLFRNEIGSKNAWLRIAVEGDGTTINRDAMGARVTLSFTGSKDVMMRERHSSRGSYNSADGRVLHFGLGALSCTYSVEVRWPDGKKETFTRAQVPANKTTKIKYGVGVVK